MESRISPLQDDALGVLERPGVRVPRTLKLKARLYTGGNFRKKYCEIKGLTRYHSINNKRCLSACFFCICFPRLLFARSASLDAKNILLI